MTTLLLVFVTLRVIAAISIEVSGEERPHRSIHRPGPESGRGVLDLVPLVPGRVSLRRLAFPRPLPFSEETERNRSDGPCV